MAPPLEFFVHALKEVRAGRAMGDDGTQDVKRKKLVKMKFCLAEALRTQTRRKLQDQCTLTLHSDASKARLLLRAQGCTPDTLQPMHAVLGTLPMQNGSDAACIAKSVLAILGDLCTPCKFADEIEGFRQVACPAEGWPLDQALLRHVLSIVEVFNADAAADEQLAGQLLSTPATSLSDAFAVFQESPTSQAIFAVTLESLTGAFPNVKVLNKDKPHAARRIVSRTYKCDPLLKRIVAEIFMNSESIVQQLHFSDNLRMKYGQNVRAMQFNPLWHETSTKFSAAKHRFDSWSMPFAKVVLTLEAVIQTAQSAHDERPSEKVGRAARHFLSLLNEETVLCLGMLADAGEENLQLIRFLDSEHMATPALARHVADFVKKIHVLFCKGAALQTGYTAVALEFLQRPRTIYVDRRPKRLGGLPRPQMADVAHECLKRFASWTKLAEEVVAAEFPQFEILQAMSCFELTPMSDRRLLDGSTAQTEAKSLEEKLSKLAAVLAVDELHLKSQFHDFHALAQHKYDESGVESFVAWRACVLASHENKKRAVLHPSKTLSHVLARAAGWGASTSGVEQMFSGVRDLCKKQPRIREWHMRDEIFLLSTHGYTEAEDAELARAAVLIWAQLFGEQRASPTESAFKSVARQRAWKKQERSGTLKAQPLSDYDGFNTFVLC